jgi:hypothetical protein
MQLWCNPLAFGFSLSYSFWSPFVSLYLLGTLLAVIGSCPPRSQVACKLISPFPSPSPYTPLSKIPTPWGSPELNMNITKTTSRTWLTRSSTPPMWNLPYDRWDEHVSEINPTVRPPPAGLHPKVWPPPGDRTFLCGPRQGIDSHTAGLFEYSLRARCCL